MQRQSTKIMIISTQTPDEEKMKLNQVAAGKTGTVIQDLTAGGMVHMHRDKHLHDNEKEIFQRHLASDGWLIITGHGGGSQSVNGEYIPTDLIEREVTPKLDIKCNAEDYVNLALESGALKAGSHINVLLFVCYAAERINNKDSFAQELAQEFSKKGISSQIIASTKPVGRIGGIDRFEGDILGKQIVFRAAPKDIRILDTTAGVDGKTDPTTVHKTSEPVIISKDRVEPPNRKKANEKMTDTAYLQALKTLPIEVNKFKWMQYKDLTREAAASKIAANQDLIIFRKGSDGVSLVCSLYSEKQKSIIHLRYKCVKTENNQWTAVLDKTEAKSLKRIGRKLNPPKSKHSLGNSTGLFPVAAEVKAPTEPENSSGHTPRSPKGKD